MFATKKGELKKGKSIMQENEKIALDILKELKSAKQSTRDAWKEKSLKEYPEGKQFIEQVYKMASV